MTKVIMFKDWKNQVEPEDQFKHATTTEGNITFHKKGLPSVKYKVRKISYRNKLDDVASLIRYFTDVFDTEGKLVTTLIEMDGWFDELFEVGMYIKHYTQEAYNMIFTEEIKEKILEMVKLNTEAKDLKDVNLTQIEVMLVSTIIKFMMPIISRLMYIALNGERPKDGMLYDLIHPAFDVMGQTMTTSTKLAMLVSDRVSKHYESHILLYRRHNITKEQIFYNVFHKAVVTETIYKGDFSKSVVSLIIVTIRTQLEYMSKMQYK